MNAGVENLMKLKSPRSLTDKINDHLKEIDWLLALCMDKSGTIDEEGAVCDFAEDVATTLMDAKKVANELLARVLREAKEKEQCIGQKQRLLF